jgi:hypothetical protein
MVIVASLETPSAVALIVATVVVATGLVETAKVADAEPAATTILSGTLTGALTVES